jgi:hypothetical protein
MEQGLPGEEEQEVFRNLFPPSTEAKEKEVLIAVVACSVKSSTFRYPGKLYLSSRRLCFFSEIMERAIEAQFMADWREVEKVRLLKPPSKGKASQSSKADRVRIALKRAIDFDGNEVAHVDVCIFDLESMGLLHRSVLYFIGSGLFGAWQDRSPKGQMPAEPAGGVPCRRSMSSLCSASPRRMMRADTDVHRAVVWELERRTFFLSSDWRAPFLPHDGDKQVKWCTMTDRYAAHALLPRDTEKSRAASSPPIDQVQVLGQLRQCSGWKKVVSEDTDAEGWQYGFDFYVSDKYWGQTCTGNCFVRRRQWQPCHTSLLERQGSDLKKSFMEEKKLDEVQVTAFETDVGCISLASLSEEFESNDWLAPGKLMGQIYGTLGAKGIETSEWSTKTKKMKGRVRFVNVAKMPVPAAPMCPPETRLNQTYHVYHDDDKLVIECVNQSLDVPYGSTFNVVTRDTFVSEGGRTRMTRAVAIEWLQAQWWLKAMAEERTIAASGALGQKWADVITKSAPRAYAAGGA